MTDTSYAGRIAASLQRALQSQHTYTESLADQRVRNGVALGFVDLDSAGEAVASVTFPMLFLEKPNFTWGLELGDNSSLVPGDFPLATATVAGWVTRVQALSTFYAGATLAIVALGLTGKGILHYTFQARSFTNPTGTVGSVGDTI